MTENLDFDAGLTLGWPYEEDCRLIISEGMLGGRDRVTSLMFGGNPGIIIGISDRGQSMSTDYGAVLRPILDAHKGVDGSALPILHAVQEAIGYIPKEAMPVIAKALNITRAEIYGVVSFYHDFRHAPAGRHVLKICRAEACQARGSDRVAEAVAAALGIKFGETSPDGQVTLEAVYCLGLCAAGPSAMLDHRIIGRLTEAKVAPLIQEMRL